MGKACPEHDEPMFECEQCSIVARIRQAAEDGQIEFASQMYIEILWPWVQRVLQAVGHPDALVTDQSMIGDFDPDCSAENKFDLRLQIMSKRLGITISPHELIYEVAYRLKQHEQDQS